MRSPSQTAGETQSGALVTMQNVALPHTARFASCRKMTARHTYENMGKCLCYKGACPTFRHNNLSKGLFCAIGKRQPLPEKKGCPCNSCLVWVECGLTGLYFCTRETLEEDTR